MAKRKRIPAETERQLLVNSGRRCCLCAFLTGCWEERRGQIAHLDQDAGNPAYDNLVFLCFDHHDQYDSTTSQSKSLQETEVRDYRDMLYKAIEAWRARGCTGLASDVGVLRVQASPVWQGRYLAAHVQMENVGQRPLRVMARFVASGEDATLRISDAVLPHGPIVLGERQSYEAMVDLGDCDPLALTEFSIVDSDGRRWQVPASRLSAFAVQARCNPFPSHLLPESERIPQTGSGQRLSADMEARPSALGPFKFLNVRLTNEGEERVPLLGASLAWDYDPPRGPEPREGVVSAAEIGAAIPASRPGPRIWLAPGDSVDVAFDGESVRCFLSMAAKDVPRDRIRLELRTAERSGWSVTGEGLPEAVEEVARSVATAIARGELQ